MFSRDDEHTIRSNDLGLLESIDLKSDDKLDEIAVTIAELVLKAQGIGALPAGQKIQGFMAEKPPAGEPACQEGVRTMIFDPSADNPANDVNSKVLNGTGLTLEISKSASFNSSNTDANAKYEGLFYRRPIPYQFNILDGRRNAVQTARVSLPNGGPIAVVKMTAGTFVETKRQAVFHEGMLISETATEPSELQGLLNIPAGIIKAILGQSGQ